MCVMIYTQPLLTNASKYSISMLIPPTEDENQSLDV